ncbi:MAG: ABC transporter permease [Thermoplasmatota archaeon]
MSREFQPGLGPFYVSLALVALLLGAPLLILLYEGWHYGLVGALADPGFLESVALTWLAASIAAGLAILLGAPTAYALARGNIRYGMRPVIEAAIASPITIPHVIIGLAILFTFSPQSPIYPIVGGVRLVNAAAGVVMAFFVVSAPITVSLLKDAFEGADERVEWAARGLGATPARTFLSVVLPARRHALVEAFLVTWARAVSEFGSVAVLAYFVIDPPFFSGVPTASVFVWNQYQISGLFVALRYAAALLVLSTLPLAALQIARRRRP